MLTLNGQNPTQLLMDGIKIGKFDANTPFFVLHRQQGSSETVARKITSGDPAKGHMAIDLTGSGLAVGDSLQVKL